MGLLDRTGSYQNRQMVKSREDFPLRIFPQCLATISRAQLAMDGPPGAGWFGANNILFSYPCLTMTRGQCGKSFKVSFEVCENSAFGVLVGFFENPLTSRRFTLQSARP